MKKVGDGVLLLVEFNSQGSKKLLYLTSLLQTARNKNCRSTHVLQNDIRTSILYQTLANLAMFLLL